MGIKGCVFQKKVNRSSIRTSLSYLKQFLILFIFLCNLIGMNPVSVAHAGSGGVKWTAYNDCVTTSGQHQASNVTSIALSGSGTLVDQETGDSTGVTVAITSSGTVNKDTMYGDDTNSGTDAYETFNSFLDLAGNLKLGSDSAKVVLTFSNLNPDRVYTFATTANRASSSYTRNSLFTISGIDSATNASTNEVGLVSDLSVYFNTGYNTVNGYVARWTDIDPGIDGQFTVTVSRYVSSTEAYGPSAFMLQESEATEQFTLSVGSDENGGVTLDPDGGVYDAGTDVTITPVASQGYTFDSWSGDNAGDLTDNGDGSFTITMDADKSLYANFVAIAQYSLVVTTDGNGTVTLDPDGGVYGSGTEVILTPEGYSGYAFSEWAGDNAGDLTDNGDGTYAITIDSDKILSATFVSVPQYTLSVNLVGNGSVSLDPSGGTYYQGTAVKLTPSADPGSQFSGWSGSNAGDLSDNGDGTYTITMDTNKDITATFVELSQYSLTINIQGNGNVALDPDGGIYDAGTTVTLTATSGSGYEFSGWEGDLTGNENPISILMNSEKTVTATFAVVQCTTVNLNATEDTYLRSSYSTRNYGGSTTIQASPRTSYPQGVLMRWDLSSIPSDVIVTNASLTLYVTDGSAYAFSLYELVQSWVEGTSNDVISSTSVNWDTYDGVNSWGTAGAQGTADRNSTNLWDATSSTFTSTGSTTVDLNDSGVGVVQGWVTTPASNYGLTIQNYSGGSTADYLIFYSSEGSTPPVLSITYCTASTDPTIVTNGKLTEFSSQPGVPSDSQTYVVSGSNLNGDISISAPEGFEISTEDISYSDELTLAQVGGEVSATTIYVRLNSDVEGIFSGSIVHTSSGADDKNVAVSGEVLPTYTLTVNSDGNGSVTLNPTGGSYLSGTVVILTPTGNSGYTFDSWSGDNASDVTTNGDGTYSITMNANKSITASFTEGWIAYNDMNPFSGDENATNVTEHTYETTDGALVNYETGTTLPVTITGSCVDENGDAITCDINWEDYGAQANSGTDAGDIFGATNLEIVDLQNMVQITDTDYDYVITFENLDPDATYTVTTTTNRADSSYTGIRYTRVTIEGAETYSNASGSVGTELAMKVRKELTRKRQG